MSVVSQRRPRFYGPRPRQHKRIPGPLVSCVVCPVRWKCVRASSLPQVVEGDERKLRALIQRELYRRDVVTEQMRAGLLAHARLEAQRHVEKDLPRILQRLRNRDRFYFTASLCSPRWGLRAHPDAVLAEPEQRGLQHILRLTVIEDKSHVEGRFYAQLTAMAMVFSDPDCYIAPAALLDEVETERQRLYPQLPYDGIDVYATFNFYTDPAAPRNAPEPPSKYEPLTDPWQGRTFDVLRKKRTLLRLWEAPQAVPSGTQLIFTTRPRAGLDTLTELPAEGGKIGLYKPKSE